MATTIVHCKKDKYDIYIGRGSIYGNPYTHIKNRDTKAEFIVETRKDAIEKYKEYLLNNPELLEQIKKLKNKTLGCFCKPKSCHGDIIKEILDSKDTYSIF
jgi:hypothetical protein